MQLLTPEIRTRIESMVLDAIKRLPPNIDPTDTRFLEWVDSLIRYHAQHPMEDAEEKPPVLGGIGVADKDVRLDTAAGDPFLESGLAQIQAGDPAAKFYYPGAVDGLLNDYNDWVADPDNAQPYLDTLQIDDPFVFDLRAYTPGMDSQTYPDYHQQHKDILYNRWATSGKAKKLLQAQMGSGESRYFKSFFEFPPTSYLSYGVYSDHDGDYWLIQIGYGYISRAKFTYTSNGDLLHSALKSESGGRRIERIDDVYEDEVLRKLESYVLACAIGIGEWETLGEYEVEGTPIYYGWNYDWNGDHATIVTSTKEYEGDNLLGLRNRLYVIDMTTTPATLTMEENELGTPGIEDITIYYPDWGQTPGRMLAWFPKALEEEWTDIDSDMPFYAYYLEDDTLCEVWFRHNADVYKPQVSYVTYTDSLPDACGGAGVAARETFSTLAGGANEYANGFYLKNGPGGGLDLFTEYTSGVGVYELQWQSNANGSTGQACLNFTLNGPNVLEYKDCTGGFVAADIGSPKCCGDHYRVDLTCGDAHWTRDYYQSRTHLVGSIMMFNFHDPESVTLIKRDYDGWSGHTNVVRNWTNQIMEWSNYSAGDGKQGYPWGSFTGELFPDLFGVRVCTTTYTCPCIIAGEDANTSTGKAASGTEIEIRHYLVTNNEVVTVLNETYDNWDDAGDYENIMEPSFDFPFYEEKIYCLMSQSGNYFASSDLTTEHPENITNTDLDPDLGEGALWLGRG